MSASYSIDFEHNLTIFLIVRLCPFCLWRCKYKGILKILEVAEKWGIKEHRINTLCLEGYVEGAFRFGNT